MTSLWTKLNRLILIECDHCPCVPPVCPCTPASAFSIAYGSVRLRSSALLNCTCPHTTGAVNLACDYLDNRVWMATYVRTFTQNMGYLCGGNASLRTVSVNLYDTPDFAIPGTNPNEQPVDTGCLGASQPPGDGTWRIRILAYMPCTNATGCAFRMMLAPSSAYGDTTPLSFNTPCGKSAETFLTPGSTAAWPGGPTWKCGDPFWIPFDNPMFDRCVPTFPHPIVTPL